MRLALCLWLLLDSLFFVAARSPLASLDEVSPRPRRAFRELSPTALDALTTLDRSSEGFIDPAVKDGALKAILIPRVGAYKSRARRRLGCAAGRADRSHRAFRTSSRNGWQVSRERYNPSMLPTNLDCVSLFVQKYLTNIFSELKWDIETVSCGHPGSRSRSSRC